MRALVGLIFDHPGNNNSIENILAEKNAQNPAYEWVECIGQTLNAEDHPIAANFLGVVNIGGVLKIEIPDLRGKVTAGIGGYTDSAGNELLIESNVIGTYKHKLTVDELPEHDHSDAAIGANGTAGIGAQFFISGTGVTGKTGGDQPHNNIQPTYGTYKIMLLDKSV